MTIRLERISLLKIKLSLAPVWTAYPVPRETHRRRRWPSSPVSAETAAAPPPRSRTGTRHSLYPRASPDPPSSSCRWGLRS